MAISNVLARAKDSFLSITSAQGLSATAKSQGRANLEVTRKNYVINGGMQISQENGSTAVTTSGPYPVDQFLVGFGNGGASSIAQVASPTPGGSPNRLRWTVTTADAAVAAGDWAVLETMLEGNRIADLGLGTASAKTFTIQFGVKAPAGTYCVAIENGAQNRSYVAEYTIAPGEANTEVVKSVTIPGDVTGTWPTDNTRALCIFWALMGGTTFQTTPGSWVAGNFFSSPNQFNLMGTVGNVFELFDVGLYEGTVAPAFQLPDYAIELELCQRYWELVTCPYLYLGGSLTGTAGYGGVPYLVPKRTTPTASLGASWQYWNGGGVAGFTPTFSPQPHALWWTATGLTNFNGWPGVGTAKINARL